MSKRQTSFYRPGNYQPEQSVGYLMRRLTVALAAGVEHELGSCGLTNAQWVPLYKLRFCPVSTAAELARECHLDAGATTRMLDRLEAKGFVRRVRSSQDRRVVNLELTPEGRTAAEKIPPAVCEVQNAHLRGFSHEELDTLKGLLQRMLDNAQQLQADRESKGNPEQ